MGNSGVSMAITAGVILLCSPSFAFFVQSTFKYKVNIGLFYSFVNTALSFSLESDLHAFLFEVDNMDLLPVWRE